MPPPPDNLFKDFHTTLKRGPNGHALGSSYSDLLSLIRSSEGRTVLKSLCTLGGSSLCMTIAYWLEHPDLLLSKAASFFLSKLPPDTMFTGPYGPETFESKHLRKLRCIPDKNGKTRIIALFDYWSQTTLKPLHDYIMHCLTFFPDDCTYSQGDKLSGYPQIQKGKYWCFDLKSATDRFPMTYQTMVLSKLIGPERTEAWRNIMVDLPFESPVDKQPIKYAVGQPLGAYSSWAVFTLSHHVLLHYCAHKNNMSAKGQYVILGDDIVIFSRAMARTYVSILKIMGVEVNSTKSLISYTLCEFAKRYWYKGEEITPLPLSGLIKSLKRVYLLIPFIESLVKINWLTQEVVDQRIISIVLSIYRSLGLPRLRRLALKAKIFNLSSKVLKSKISESDGLHAITDLFDLPSTGCNRMTSYFGLVKLAMTTQAMIRCQAKRVRQTVDPGMPSFLAFTAIVGNNESSFLSNTLDEIKEWLLPGYYRHGCLLPSVSDKMLVRNAVWDHTTLTIRSDSMVQTYVPHISLTERCNTVDDLWYNYLSSVNTGTVRVSLSTLPEIPFLDGDLLKGMTDSDEEQLPLKEIQIIGYRVLSLLKVSLYSHNTSTTKLLSSSCQGVVTECNPHSWKSSSPHRGKAFKSQSPLGTFTNDRLRSGKLVHEVKGLRLGTVFG